MTTAVIELVTYKLKVGIEKSQHDASHQKINAFCQQQPGFLYRSISEDASGVFHDIVYWQDMAAATQASTAFEQSPLCSSLMALTDPESVKVQHMPVIAEVLSCQSEPA